MSKGSQGTMWSLGSAGSGSDRGLADQGSGVGESEGNLANHFPFPAQN